MTSLCVTTSSCCQPVVLLEWPAVFIDTEPGYFLLFGEGAGSAWEGDTAWMSDPEGPTGYSRAWQHVQCTKWREEGGRRGHSGWWCFYPSHCHLWWGPLSWRWVNTCLAMGSRELIPCSALLCLCVWLLLSLINFLYFNPQILSLLPFQSSPQNQHTLCSLHSIKTFPYSLALSSLEECRKQRDNEETWELNPKPITR